MPSVLCPQSASTVAGAALSASMTRAVSPPDATAPRGRNASAGPAASKNSTLYPQKGSSASAGHQYPQTVEATWQSPLSLTTGQYLAFASGFLCTLNANVCGYYLSPMYPWVTVQWPFSELY